MGRDRTHHFARGAMPERSERISRSCRAVSAITGCHRSGTFCHRHRRRAFSLLELMIGIAILGLGMIMVATIFPVAWSRTRTLSEYTAQRSVTAGAEMVVKSLVHVSSPSVLSSSFLGDLVWDLKDPDAPSDDEVVRVCDDWPKKWPDDWAYLTDTWVHALNLENVQVEERRFVSEDPWRIEESGSHLVDRVLNLPDELVARAFFSKQISFYQRVYPPMATRENVSIDDEFTGDDDTWDDALATRRFCWSVLHRLPQPIERKDQTRSFDLYIVTLRRPNPNYRYARQQTEQIEKDSVPNPCDLTTPAVVPKAMPPEKDVMVPVPWRVQVEFPATLAKEREATGVPTEILVPSPDIAAEDEVKRMLGAMFPAGTYFIDEVTGDVFRVVKRRETGTNAEQAYLTLDREVFFEDLYLEERCAGGSNKWARCEVAANCPSGDCLDDPRCTEERMDRNLLRECELLRTVWVYPPPVEAERGSEDTLVFDGTPPVVAINRQVLKVNPARPN